MNCGIPGCYLTQNHTHETATRSEWPSMDDFKAENKKLRAEVETLKRMNQEIASSNADHVGWHRDMVLQVDDLRKVLGHIANCLGIAGLTGTIDKADCQLLRESALNVLWATHHDIGEAR